MKCPKCHAENRETRKFCAKCAKCGEKLLILCPQCASENLPDEQFCGECGHDLRKPKETRSLDFQQPRSYTPEHLADKILNTRSSIEGERKTVTIMFADVTGSTEPEQIEAAEQEILQGISLLEELKLPCFSGDGYLWLGEVYAESGRRDEALENLKKAEGMFREMGMDYWLGKAQEVIARL
ncbi:MAG: zinc ribbon domain-containing protein [Desulfomonilaceae bacterium]